MADPLTGEVRAFLEAGTRTGKLAALTAGGWPHVTPIWFLLDHAEIVFSTGRETVKGRHIARDGRVSLCVDAEDPPFAYVQVRGRARIDEESDLLEWTTRIAERYMGADQADAFGRRNAVASEMLVRLRPERVIADFDVAGW